MTKETTKEQHVRQNNERIIVEAASGITTILYRAHVSSAQMQGEELTVHFVGQATPTILHGENAQKVLAWLTHEATK